MEKSKTRQKRENRNTQNIEIIDLNVIESIYILY